jgi:alginate O-acetyltransferase complex protein AlgI
MITMFLGGLWHGASWTFVVWGLLHGFYLVVEHLLKQIFPDVSWAKKGLGRFSLGILTFLIVSATWVFFRSSDFPTALLLLGSLFNFGGSGAQLLLTREILQVTLVVGGLLASHWYLHEKQLEHAMQNLPAWWVVVIWSTMLCGLILTQGAGDAFIYFQF